MTHLRYLIPAALSALFALNLHADAIIPEVFLHQNVRVAGVFDRNADLDKSTVLGFEVGYAQAIHPIDQMVFSFGHISSSDLEQNYFLLSFEQHFKLNPQLAPYGTTGVGFIWNDDKRGNDDRESLYGKVAGGLIYQAAERLAVYGEVSYLVATKGIWLDGPGFENTNFQASIGIRYSF